MITLVTVREIISDHRSWASQVAALGSRFEAVHLAAITVLIGDVETQVIKGAGHLLPIEWPHITTAVATDGVARKGVV